MVRINNLNMTKTVGFNLNWGCSRLAEVLLYENEDKSL